MKTAIYVIITAVVSAFASLVIAATLEATKPAGLYVPAVLFYNKGVFVVEKQASEKSFATAAECQKVVDGIAAELMALNDRPQDATAVGVCFNVPSVVTKPAHEPNKAYHDNTPSVLGGTDSERI